MSLIVTSICDYFYFLDEAYADAYFAKISSSLRLYGYVNLPTFYKLKLN